MKISTISLRAFVSATSLILSTGVCCAQQTVTCQGAIPIGGHPNLRKGVVERVVSIMRRPSARGAFFVSKLEIDADGAPNAYHPDDAKGLDYKSDAGYPKSCNVLVCVDPKRPAAGYVKTTKAPYAGFFVSQSSLEDPTFARSDYRRYVNAATVPYIALPPTAVRAIGAKYGDLAMIVDLHTRKMSAAVFADGGTEHTLGEGSIALGGALGVNPSPKAGGAGYEVFFVVFPATATAPPWPRGADSITKTAALLFDQWGGLAIANACAADLLSRDSKAVHP